jgi:Bacterial conjugation TrbI-like protein
MRDGESSEPNPRAGASARLLECVRYRLVALPPDPARLAPGRRPQLAHRYGQDGVQVIWDRVIYPDGSSLDLSGMIRQDAHGFSGFRDKVDRHYTRLIGFAVLTSLFAAASEISQNQNRSLLTYPSPAQLAGSAVGQQASESRRPSHQAQSELSAHGQDRSRISF